MRVFNLLKLGLYTLVLTLLLGSARAGVLTFEHNIEFSGATPPEGAAPWLTATFDDSFGGANTVRLTMSTSGLTDAEFVSQWYFNFDPDLVPSSLSVSAVDLSDVGPTTLSLGVDTFQADGDGKYDILFDFPPPPGQFADKFTAGEQVVVDFTYISPIDVNSFDFLSAPAGGHGPFLSAAHVQGIGPNDGDSGWVAPGGDVPPQQIPEPGILALLGTGLLGMTLLGRRRRKVD
jgi:hypothetical protein